MASAYFNSWTQRCHRSFAPSPIRASWGRTGRWFSNAKSVAPDPTRKFGGTRCRSNGLAEVFNMTRAKEIGFLTSSRHQMVKQNEQIKGWGVYKRLTRNCPGCTTSSLVVHDCRVTLDFALQSQVAAISRVGDFTVLQHDDGYFDSIHC